MTPFEIISPYFAWVNKENFPYVVQVYGQLDIPFWDDYTESLHQCATDLMQACQSSFKFLVLTFRPLLQLLFIILSGLFEVLLKKGLISLQKGSKQVKAGIIWFYNFQRSLSKEQVVGEIGIIACIMGIYYLRKWLKRQTYWTRATQWCSNQKKKVKKSYMNAVKRLSEVSLALAMTLPHLLFLGIVVAWKMLLPRALEYMVHETYTTTAMCLWYPFGSTLFLIHHRRQEGRSPGDKKGLVVKTEGNSAQLVANGKTSKDLKISSGKKARVETKSSNVSDSSFWLQYWITYSIIQAFGQVCHMVPVFGRFVAKHPFFQSISAEFKLFFFMWIFTMEALMGGNAEDTILSQASPLKLTRRYLNPIVLDLDTVVSQAISAARWKSLVFSKVQRVLDVFVMVRFLSEERKDWLLHILEESRVLLVPSITLLMPSFATQFGVAYVQYLVPSAKSARVRGASKQFMFLQYWVLHCIFFGLLTWLAGLLWWIPFSTHAIFVAWCNLSFPKTIEKYYAVLELELVTFGFLSGTSGIAVDDTHTAQLFSAISKRLPTAQNGNSATSTATKDSDSSMPELSSEKSPASLTAARGKGVNSASSGEGGTTAAPTPLP